MILDAAIDMHKLAFQAAVLDPESGELVEERFAADRESLARWADGWRDRVEAVAIEATTGWRWVWRELVARGFEVRLAEPVQARALLGRRRSAKTDRLDARWLASCWPRRCCRWGQRLHACLLHEGGPARGRSCSGRRARAGRRRFGCPPTPACRSTRSWR